MSAHRFSRLIFALALSACALSNARAQGAGDQPQANAAIAGRVTAGERGVAGVTILLMPPDYGPRLKTVARARTDAEGRYRMSGVPAGRYQVITVAPAFVVERQPRGWPPGRPVTLAPGDSIEDLDFSIRRGGVITGKVLDPEGRAVVAEPVQIRALDEKTNAGLPGMFPMNQTDDRGVYRLYGLPAGQYRVSVGRERGVGMVRMGGPGRFYARTFYPSETEESRAKIVEVTEGGEAADIDITLGKPERMLKASGRILFAGTNQPAANVLVGYGAISQDHIGASGAGLRTNARGEFEIETLLPNQRYGVFAVPEGEAGWYSEVTTFEVADSEVNGIEVKLRRGASVSGTVAIEGTSDRATLARLLQRVTLQVHTTTEPNEFASPAYFNPIRVGPDGSFRASGLRPGRASIHLSGYPPVKGLSLVRVEQNDVEKREGIELTEGAQVSGVRVVLVYGTGSVRGQVTFRSGDQQAALPEGTRLFAAARRGAAQFAPGVSRAVEVDARGRFLIEDLPAGEFEVLVYPIGPPSRVRRASQTIFVPEGGEVTLTLALDIAPQAGGVNDR